MLEARSEPVVELVDVDGTRVGTMGKVEAHVAPGHLHRAISVFLVDAHGRVILQQRAATKYHSPGTWANSCCGHPNPGERPATAAARRVFDELGVRIVPSAFEPAGIVVYCERDPQTGLVEREYDHLFVAPFSGSLHPDADEVAAVAEIGIDDLLSGATRGLRVAPWFDIVTKAASPKLATFLTR